MVTRFLRLFGLVGLALCIGTLVRADDSVRSPQRFAPVEDETHLMTLLETRSVQREIGLTKTQSDQLQILHSTQFKRNNPLLMQYRDANSNPIKRAEIGRQLELQTREFRREIRDLLTPSQARRLVQISIQHAGYKAAALPEVVDELGITAQQLQAIKKELDIREAEWRKLETEAGETRIREFPKSGLKWDAYLQSRPYLDLRKKLAADIAALDRRIASEIERSLSPAQRQKFQAMRGDPFDPEKHRTADDPKTP